MRAMLAVPAIAQAENITVSNEEVDAEYARLARLHGNPEEEIRRVLARGCCGRRPYQPEGPALSAGPCSCHVDRRKGVIVWAFLQELRWMH